MFSEHELSVKQVDAGLQVRVDSGCWRHVEAKRESHNGRFTIKCSIDGQLSTFSAVISPEEVSIFNAVRWSQFKSCLENIHHYLI